MVSISAARRSWHFALDPWLCAAVFQQLCPFHRIIPAKHMPKYLTSQSSRPGAGISSSTAAVGAVPWIRRHLFEKINGCSEIGKSTKTSLCTLEAYLFCHCVTHFTSFWKPLRNRRSPESASDVILHRLEPNPIFLDSDLRGGAAEEATIGIFARLELGPEERF
jgi:hypothetical protein